MEATFSNHYLEIKSATSLGRDKLVKRLMGITKDILLPISVVILAGCGGGSSTTPVAQTQTAALALAQDQDQVLALTTLSEPIVSGTTIDVLVLYTKEADESVAQEGGAEAKIRHYFAVTDKINRDSGIDLKYNIVHIEESTYIDEDVEIVANLENITYAKKRSDEGRAVAALRDKHKADEVVGFLGEASNCGNAWLNIYQDPDWAYAIVAIDCSSDSVAHELGHNLGLNHSHRQGDKGQFGFSVGHGVDDEFVTVMSYRKPFGYPDTAMYYSNPEIIDCGVTSKQACGVPIGEYEEAYAAESIRRVMEKVSDFR